MTQSRRTAPRRNGLLFLCAGNRARSQIAEAFARYIGPSDYRYYSAGHAAAAELDAWAVKVMREVGMDLTSHTPKSLGAIPLNTIATVISLCEEETGAGLPTEVLFLDWPIPDPIQDPGEEDLMQACRRVRDQIRELVSRLF